MFYGQFFVLLIMLWVVTYTMEHSMDHSMFNIRLPFDGRSESSGLTVAWWLRIMDDTFGRRSDCSSYGGFVLITRFTWKRTSASWLIRLCGRERLLKCCWKSEASMFSRLESGSSSSASSKNGLLSHSPPKDLLKRATLDSELKKWNCIKTKNCFQSSLSLSLSKR